MTVQELIAELQTMPQTAKVVFPDTYVQSEGWTKGHENATCTVEGVEQVSKKKVLLFGE